MPLYMDSDLIGSSKRVSYDVSSHIRRPYWLGIRLQQVTELEEKHSQSDDVTRCPIMIRTLIRRALPFTQPSLVA